MKSLIIFQGDSHPLQGTRHVSTSQPRLEPFQELQCFSFSFEELCSSRYKRCKVAVPQGWRRSSPQAGHAADSQAPTSPPATGQTWLGQSTWQQAPFGAAGLESCSWGLCICELGVYQDPLAGLQCVVLLPAARCAHAELFPKASS